MMNFLTINDLNLNKVILILIVLVTVNGFSTSNNPPYLYNFSIFLEDDCDACGSSNSGGSLGMGGVIDNNFLGVRYLYQKYESKDGIFIDSPKIYENFNTVQLWSRIPIIKKLEAQVFVPYHFHNRKYVTKETAINGLGDVSIYLNYTLTNKTGGSYNKKINHLLKVGAGLKLPTGKYDVAINSLVNPSFQLGTGSLDYITSLQYVLKRNSFGVTNHVNYIIKTTNSNDYRFGNQFNFNTAFFYVFKDNKNRVLVPSGGVSGEFYEQNKQFNLSVTKTEGYAMFANIGLEYNTKNITVGTSAMYPISQNLAQGAISVKYRTALYFNYNF